MKILKLTVRFPPAPGGVEFQQLAICKELKRREHEIEVYTSDLYTEIPWKKLNGDNSEVEGIPVRRFKAFSLKGDLQYSIMPNMLRAVIAGKWDIIHAHSYGFFPSHVGAIAARKGIGKFVFTPHIHPGETSWGGAKRQRFRKIYDEYVGGGVKKRADRIICVSQGEKDYAISVGFEESKISIVSDSVDIRRFDGLQKGAFKSAFDIDSDFVLFVGRLAKNKGLEHLVHAVPQVIKKFPDTRFVLIGEDEGMQDVLLHQAKKLGIDDSILITGALEYQSVSEAFLDCSVFVLPSEFEAFGIVLAEAQAAKKPVVATRVGGVPNVVKDNETGILVNYSDTQALADALFEFLGDKSKSAAFGEAGYKWVSKNFAIEKVVDRLERVYSDL